MLLFSGYWNQIFESVYRYINAIHIDCVLKIVLDVLFMIHCFIALPATIAHSTNKWTASEVYSQMVATKLSIPQLHGITFSVYIYRITDTVMYIQPAPTWQQRQSRCVYKLYSRLLYILDFSIKEMLLFYWIKLEFYLVVGALDERTCLASMTGSECVVAMMIHKLWTTNYRHDNCLVQSVNVQVWHLSW